MPPASASRALDARGAGGRQRHAGDGAPATAATASSSGQGTGEKSIKSQHNQIKEITDKISTALHVLFRESRRRGRVRQRTGKRARTAAGAWSPWKGPGSGAETEGLGNEDGASSSSSGNSGRSKDSFDDVGSDHSYQDDADVDHAGEAEGEETRDWNLEKMDKEARNTPFCLSQEKFHTVVLRGVRDISEAP
jgi:hypothetical protein